MRGTSQSIEVLGDEADLFRRHNCELVRDVGSKVGVPVAVAEDACSAAWAALLRTQPARDNIAAWLYVVAIREAIRLWDRERSALPLDGISHSEAESALASSGGCPVSASELAVDVRNALAALAALPPHQRRATGLRIAGCSHDQIASATGTTRRQVQRHLAQGRARLAAA